MSGSARAAGRTHKGIPAATLLGTAGACPILPALLRVGFDHCVFSRPYRDWENRINHRPFRHPAAGRAVGLSFVMGPLRPPPPPALLCRRTFSGEIEPGPNRIVDPVSQTPNAAVAASRRTAAFPDFNDCSRSTTNGRNRPTRVSGSAPYRSFDRDYSITLSARTRIDCGILIPSVFAVLRLTANSNLVGCSTGRSAGLAPLRILST